MWLASSADGFLFLPALAAKATAKHFKTVESVGSTYHPYPRRDEHFDIFLCRDLDRMREANVRFVDAGENLALAPTVQVAHRGLMNSPGHRANILYPQFGRVGIGIMDGGIRGLMISQEFRN